MLIRVPNPPILFRTPPEEDGSRCPPQRPPSEESLYPHDKRKVNTLGALLQTKDAISASFKMIGASRLRLLPAGRTLAREPRAFPEASTRPTLPATIRDELLELYAFIFCQRGFRQLGMTFEQFLLVAAAIKPADLPAIREDCSLKAEGRYP